MFKSNKNIPMTVGNVYAVKLPDSRYGAIRIIDKQNPSTTLVTTPYISDRLPNIDDEKLKQTLVQNRFFFDGQKAGSIVDGKPPKELILIGNIQMKEERRFPSYSGVWDKETGIEAYYEWRWEHDRENFEKEMQEDEERMARESLAKVQVPKKMMSEEMFWSIISLVDDEDIEAAIQKLAGLGVRNIKQFEETLSYKLFQLDTEEHARNIGVYSYKDENKHFSVDLFLYFRCAVITNGRDFYELVLQNPIHMPGNDTCEPILDLASEAYELRTGKEFEYETGCDYETFSNRKGWE
ncbi:DUF4240 domain-containing protein [Fictibacillus sp. 18YEL24]|uniref:DUF4240 domain-containing protein n=1 Tax=Fictibacillus sp. 18YEL24 TaxID=2745875 RepID=UPI0018CFA43D|nr:DUF4240 domain-containing protein [Fictibacillus sp. 18YEL24]MBH0168179.1 DUF4240 domain-containing protein [Fictibacillus sp. 18YEL24]